MSDTWCYARNCWGPNLRDLFGNRVLREVTEVKGAFGVGRRPREGQVRARTGSEGTREQGRGAQGERPPRFGRRVGLAAWPQRAKALRPATPLLFCRSPSPRRQPEPRQASPGAAPPLRFADGRWRRTEEARPTAQHADEGEQTATQKTPGSVDAEPLEVT